MQASTLRSPTFLHAKLGSGQSDLLLSDWQHDNRDPLQVCPPHNSPTRQFWWGGQEASGNLVAFSTGQPSCTELEFALRVDKKEDRFPLLTLVVDEKEDRFPLV